MHSEWRIQRQDPRVYAYFMVDDAGNLAMVKEMKRHSAVAWKYVIEDEYALKIYQLLSYALVIGS
jgi:hypothetical protein